MNRVLLGLVIYLSMFSIAHSVSFILDTTLTTGAAPHAIISADFNNDGLNDIASVTIEDDKLLVYLSTSLLTYDVPQSYSIPSGPYDIDTADFNLDGFMDIVTTSGANNMIYIFVNDGDGTFQEETSFVANVDHAVRIETAYLNNDNVPDLLVSNVFGSTIQLFFFDSLLNIIKPVPPIKKF